MDDIDMDNTNITELTHMEEQFKKVRNFCYAHGMTKTDKDIAEGDEVIEFITSLLSNDAIISGEKDKCEHINTTTKKELDTYPYGWDMTITECNDCGEVVDSN
jgi:hypothetical protein